MSSKANNFADERLIAWHDVFESHLEGVKWLKHEAALISNLECLNDGLRPGFLWDFPPIPSKGQMQRTIDCLKDRSLLNTNVHILELHQDLLLVNIHCLLCRLSRPEHFYQFVDISQHLDKPELAEDCELISQILLLLAKEFKIFAKASELHTATTCFRLNLDAKQMCVPTVLGLCLGYPVVYWYNKQSQESFLPCEMLTVFNIQADISRECKSVSIFSFSVPTVVQPKVATHIRSWLKRSSDKPSLHKLLLNVVIKEKTVISSSVIL